jgi:hypothetical protein
MTICVKIWLSLDICVKYAQRVKIWPFVWKFDIHWIFMWNMLNVWKYGHLCENLTFIEYLCEICSMCDNVVIWCLGSISDALCAVSEALCSVSDRHYTESGNCSVSDEEKGRCALTSCVSHLRKKGDASIKCAFRNSGKGRRALWGAAPFYLIALKNNANRLFSMPCFMH